MRFAAVVIVGDRKGHVGFGTGKAQEVPEAIRKAVEAGKKRMIKVPTVGTTIPHEVMGHYGSGNIMLKPAEAGSGVATMDGLSKLKTREDVLKLRESAKSLED